MPILDEGNFNQQAATGNRKYMEMAERGDDYLVIRDVAKKDGLEGSELSAIMSMVDSILIKNQNKEWHKDTALVTILIGVLILFGGIFFMIYCWNISLRGLFFGIGLSTVGTMMILRGKGWG